MQFLFQPLTWGFMLVGVPILVHLINMLRHRRQSWAAMDFLLESYRKNRRWVLLKQWILLALRILAMFLLVAMLARWISSSQSLSWFGGRVTHHYILLDDSYSMGEQEKGQTAYAKALTAVQALIRAVATQPGEHQLTLLRWSRAELANRADKEQARVDVAADLISQTIPRDPARLLDRIAASQPSSLQLSAEPALELIEPLIATHGNEQVELYFVTDLRRNEWSQPESLKAKLGSLVRGSSRIQFIDCAEGQAANLSLAGLEPEQGTWAAGVPLMAKFQVTNHGSLPAQNVVVKVRSILYPEGIAKPNLNAPYSGDALDAPPVVIDRIGPGETATRQVQLVFPSAGQHVVEASIAEDRLLQDNHRWCVIGIRQSQKILVIDGSADPNTQSFIKFALQPDGRQPTGMSVQREDPAYLRDTTPESLSAWDVVVLLEVPQLDPQAVSMLEAYVKSGGGVAYIAGPSSTIQSINSYYRDGAGFFPVPISDITEHLIRPGNDQPQVVATDHPILEQLKGMETSPFQLVEIRKQLKVAGKLDTTGNLEVVAYGPDQLPLVVDKRYGNGHVVALLTGLTSDAASGSARLLGGNQKVAWSNWAQDPTFVILTLRMVGYLGSFRRDVTNVPVGMPLKSSFAGAAFIGNADVILPAQGDGPRAKITVTTNQDSPEQAVPVVLPLNLSDENTQLDALLRPGIFETWMQTVDDTFVVQNIAHNVAPGEGNLTRVTRSELEERLSPLKISVQSADSLSGAAWSPEAASYSSLLLALLVIVLLAEQTLAYSASYHLPPVAKSGVA